MQHEAGHFLIAYLVGILPKGYTLSSLEALKKEGSLNVQAGTAFVDFEFLEEVGCFLLSAFTLEIPSLIVLFFYLNAISVSIKFIYFSLFRFLNGSCGEGGWIGVTGTPCSLESLLLNGAITLLLYPGPLVMN